MIKLILLGAIISASAIGAWAINLDPAYFEFRSCNGALHPYDDRVLAAIAEIPDANSHNEFVENLERLTNEEKDEFKHSEYRDLLALSRVDEHCDYTPKVVHEYSLYKELHRAMEQKGDPRHSKVKSVVDYLDRAANEGKFNMCLKGVKDTIISIMGSLRRDEVKFDSFMRTGYQLQDADDSKLLEVAKRFSFADPELNVKRLVELFSRDPKVRRGEQLVEYLKDICILPRFSLMYFFDLYNIVRAVGGSEVDEVPVKFKKFNEYYRICLALWKEKDSDKQERCRQTEAIIERRIRGCRVFPCFK